MNRLERMVWVDLETTGLDPKTDVILEIAVVITDGDLNEIAAKSWVIGRAAREERQNADLVVQQMHDANGLWAECEISNTLLYDVRNQVKGFIMEHGQAGPICGSSPHFDKSFLDVEMPEVARLFNHRVFDVSTLKQTCRQRRIDQASRGVPAHRALADIRNSIADAKACIIALSNIGAPEAP